MATQQKVHHDVPADALTVLKPQKLGRHYHKIPQLIKEAAGKHPQLMGDYFLRSFRISIELQGVRVLDRCDEPASCIYQTELGRVGFTIDRRLLAEALESYYGGSGSTQADMPPISASEHRMRSRLGMRIIEIFTRTIMSGNSFEELTEHENDYEQIHWEYIAEFQFYCSATEDKHSLFIYLDETLVDALLSHLSHPTASQTSGNPKQSIKQLPVRLDCVIAAAELPLAQVLGLQAGDILTLRPLERYEIMINQHTLFRGAIFEEGGALYLTSLESVKSQ